MKDELIQIAPPGQRQSRRTFLKTMGVVGAASGLAACHDPEHILPLLVPDPRAIAGKPQMFATVCRECPAGCGMVARVNTGRASKAEGNPDHPVNRGKLCLRGQTSLQGLYNPDRIRQPLQRDRHGVLRPLTWTEAMARWRGAMATASASGPVSPPGASGIVWMGQLEAGSFDVLLRAWLEGYGAAPPLYYEYFSYDAVRRGFALTHQHAVVPRYHIDRARYLLSFGADYLETYVSNVEFAGDFAAMHSFGHTPTPARTVYVGPRLSLTGANADEYWAARPGTEALLAWALLDLVEAAAAASATPAGHTAALPKGVTRPQLTLEAAAASSGVARGVIERAARRLLVHRPSLVLGPGYATDSREAVSCQVAVNLLNDRLGNTGVTVVPGEPHALTACATQAEIYQTFERARAGEIQLLLLHHANPLYHHPHWADAVRSIPFKISFASWMDETTQFADLILPDHHFLEAWGDYAPWPGVTGVQQPARVPVFDTRPSGDLLLETLPPTALHALPGAAAALAAASARTGSEAESSAERPQAAEAELTGGNFPVLPPADTPYATWLRLRWSTALAAGAPSSPSAAAPAGSGIATPAPDSHGTDRWRGLLRQGVTTLAPPQWHLIENASLAPGGPAAAPLPASSQPAPFDLPPSSGAAAHNATTGQNEGQSELYLVVFPTVQLFDGRQANRSWAQEIAEPLSKIAWDGWCELNPATATRLGFSPNDVIRLRSTHGTASFPLFVTTWIRPDCIGVVLGQGHTNFGMFANDAGEAVYKLQAPAPEPGRGWCAQTVQVRLERSGRRRDLANLQPVRKQTDKKMALAVSLAEAPTAAAKTPVAPLSFYRDHHAYLTHRWGMAIDLSSCIGCNACQAACYAENNIAVWGRSSCLSHREMTWIRVEVFEGDADHPSTEMNPDLRFLPTPCMQCGNAPCEYVCPVFAAYHTDEGLNGQVYNRCVGTRYCSNNCIYKVRRFNWYTPQWPEPLNQQLNPNVTVRAKGIMEKCTFCVQRIEMAELDARTHGTQLKDGDIQTACQQTCPTQAIVFGDLLDPKSRVATLSAQPRGYGLMADENTYPAVTYLKRTKFELND